MKWSAVIAMGLMVSPAVRGAPPQFRIATYNASLNRSSAGLLASDLSTPNNLQAKQVAEILQRVRPDIVLINEFDYDAGGQSLQRFHDNYLAVSQNGRTPLNFPYRYAAPSNTGVNSGFDLDNNGSVTTNPGSNNYGNDCFGFGVFPGQYAFAVYSIFPLDVAHLRSFQFFLWKDMPGAALPDNTATPAVPLDWYSTAELNVFRLSSKNHVDLPVEIVPGQVFHLLASHPTPPSFDGAEDRNGHRNHDEIRFWADYVRNAGYVYDDANPHQSGGLAADERFIILGDMNADPVKGDSYQHAINQLLEHPLIDASFTPSSAGGGTDTADFSSTGRLRVDHVLPSKAGFTSAGGGVFWPATGDPALPLISASDHRLVWRDFIVTPVLGRCVKNLTLTYDGAGARLSWGTQAGITYTVQSSPDLVAWTSLPPEALTLDPINQLATATDTGGGGGEFYRVVAAISEP